MKTKFFALAIVAVVLLSCQEGLQNNYLYITPVADTNIETIHPNISVWADGIDNQMFTYVDTRDGKLRYRSVEKSAQLSGKVSVLMPYNADATIISEQIKLSLPQVQTPLESGIYYVGAASVKEEQNTEISLKAATAGLTIEIANKLPSLEMVSVTLRLIAQENKAPKIINLDATINPSTGKVTATADRTLTSASCHGEQFILNIFAGDYSSTTFQFEVIGNDNLCYVWQENGLSITKSRTYTLDFTSNGMMIYDAYPVDADSYISAGIPQKIGSLHFAPQNLGFDEAEHPFGLYFKQNEWHGVASSAEKEHNTDFSFLQDAWRLPTQNELESIVSKGFSDLWVRNQTIGFWIGETAETNPNDGNNLYLEAAGIADINRTVNDRTEKAYYLTAEGSVLVIHEDGYSFQPLSEGSAVSVRLVKK